MAAVKKIKATKKKSLNTKAGIAYMKTTDELKAGLLAAQIELTEVKRSHAARELANTQRPRELRVQIARIKTALNKSVKEVKDASATLSVKEKS